MRDMAVIAILLHAEEVVKKDAAVLVCTSA